MRIFMRAVLLFLSGLLQVGELKAHDITWWGNPWPGLTPSVPLTIYFPNGQNENIGIVPESGEPCWVVVNNVKVSDSTLISAVTLLPDPANSVYVRVVALRAPRNHLESATVTFDWAATGYPLLSGCTAPTTTVTVPIQISDQQPRMRISITNPRWLVVDNGYYSALQSSDCLTGPWIIEGLGQMFSLTNSGRKGSQFYQRSTLMTGNVGGYVMDPLGNSFTGIAITLYDGGVSAVTDLTGYYSFSWLPQGLNMFTITDPKTGAALNLGMPVTNNPTPPTNNPTPTIVIATAGSTNVATNTVTNVCNCTPWCAIGYATSASGMTPVYYSGGANGPGGDTSNCGTAVVTVTPPSGAPFSIRPGTRGRQNSGPNPASGTWTVVATVCGQTKTATVDVP